LSPSPTHLLLRRQSRRLEAAALARAVSGPPEGIPPRSASSLAIRMLRIAKRIVSAPITTLTPATSAGETSAIATKKAYITIAPITPSHSGTASLPRMRISSAG
jgi:hypothetical protein